MPILQKCWRSAQSYFLKTTPLWRGFFLPLQKDTILYKINLLLTISQRDSVMAVDAQLQNHAPQPVDRQDQELGRRTAARYQRSLGYQLLKALGINKHLTQWATPKTAPAPDCRL